MMPARHLLVLVISVTFLTAGCQQFPTSRTGDAPPAGAAIVEPAGEIPVGSQGPVSQPTDFGAFTATPVAIEHRGTRLATFNVEFLFDGIEPEGQATFPWKGDSAAARHHRDGVAQIIRALDADVLALQEIESLEVLEMMIEESLQDMGYRAFHVQGRDTFTRQDIGLLSRLPVDTVGRTDERAPVAGGREDYGVSKNLFARMDLGGIPTTLISVHLLARPSDPERVARREAQGVVVRDLANREAALGREIIILGDFNDYDGSILDRNASRPLSRVLAIIKSAAGGLENVMGRVPQNQRFTSLWDQNRDGIVDEGELTAIDHILLPPTFLEVLLDVSYVHAHDPTAGPDHFPVVITLGL